MKGVSTAVMFSTARRPEAMMLDDEEDASESLLFLIVTYDSIGDGNCMRKMSKVLVFFLVT